MTNFLESWIKFTKSLKRQNLLKKKENVSLKENPKRNKESKLVFRKYIKRKFSQKIEIFISLGSGSKS